MSEISYCHLQLFIKVKDVFKRYIFIEFIQSYQQRCTALEKFKCRLIIKNNNYEIIHCNLIVYWKLLKDKGLFQIKVKNIIISFKFTKYCRLLDFLNIKHFLYTICGTQRPFQLNQRHNILLYKRTMVVVNVALFDFNPDTVDIYLELLFRLAFCKLFLVKSYIFLVISINVKLT